MFSYPPAALLTIEDAHGAALAEYLFYPEHDLLYVRWHGQLTGPDIIRAAQQGTEWPERLPYSLILNDKSDTGGDWSEALPWLQYECLPLALEAGIRAMAYVFSPDRENLFASQEFVAALRPYITVELFEDLDTALAWLLNLEANPAPAGNFAPLTQ